MAPSSSSPLLVRLVALCAACAIVACDGRSAFRRRDADSTDTTTSTSGAPKHMPPVIIIPGLTSSNLTVRLDQAETFFPWCNSTTTSPEYMWPLPGNFSKPLKYLCWLDVFRTHFNSTTQEFYSKKGAEVDVLDFGGFHGDMLGPVIAPEMVRLGWVVGTTLFDAPFDWRMPAAGLVPYFGKIQSLVESTYANTGLKVSLLAVSYGPQVVLAFLDRMTQAWKDKYINWLVAVSPTWSGSPASVQGVIGGFQGFKRENATILESIILRNVAVSIHSSYWMFPRAGHTNTTWGPGEWIIKTPSKAYTAYNYTELLTDIGYEVLVPAMEYLQAEPVLAQLQPPGVRTFVTYGYNVSTPGRFVYDHDFYKNPFLWQGKATSFIPSEDGGDGLVTVRSSLRAMYEWAGKLDGTDLLYKGYAGQSHARCIIDDPSNPSGEICFRDIMALLANGTAPHDAQHIH